MKHIRQDCTRSSLALSCAEVDEKNPALITIQDSNLKSLSSSLSSFFLRLTSQAATNIDPNHTGKIIRTAYAGSVGYSSLELKFERHYCYLLGKLFQLHRIVSVIDELELTLLQFVQFYA